VTAEQPLATALERDQHHPRGQLQRLVEAAPQALLGTGPQHEAVHEHLDPVSAARVEVLRLVQVGRAPVDSRALQPPGPGRRELLAVAALASAGDGRGDHGHGAPGRGQEPLGHLLCGLGRDRLPAAGAVRPAQGGEEQPQVVVDLGYRPDRRARVGDGRALLDRDRRREAVHRLDLRPLHLLQELAGPGREALHVTALPLGVEGVEGEAALPGARGAGDDDQPVARQIAVQPLQVVNPRPADLDRTFHSVFRHVPAKDDHLIAS
jgi:hypothetical protein